MDAESDEDLLLFIEEGEEMERRQAAAAFYKRYDRLLYNFCKQYRTTLGGDSGVRDLVIMTLQRAFERAVTFNSNGIVVREQSRVHTFNWLTTIATNLMRDWLRSGSENNPLSLTSITNPGEQIEDRSLSTTDETIPRRYVRLSNEAIEENHDPTALQKFTSNDDGAPRIISVNEQCLQEALATLTEKQREIVLVSAQHSIDGKQLRLPPDILDGLCARWKTTKENIRTIRKRALDKMNEHVETNCQAPSNLP